MSLKKKLSYRSTLLFFCTMSFVSVGTYLLFSYSIKETYINKLHGIAELSGNFYLEKDELSAKSHKKVARQFKLISKESVRIYLADTKKIYINDSLSFKASDRLIEETRKKGELAFTSANRQFLSLFYKDNQGDFVIVVSGIDNHGAAQLIMLKKMLLLFALIGMGIHFLFTWLLARRTFRPFNNLLNQINSVKGDDWKLRLRYPSNGDELSLLVGEFNYLLERIETNVNIQRNFLKNASHEIKTPLAVIIGNIEVALNQQRTENEYKDILGALKNDALHLKSITESLITLSNLEVNSRPAFANVRIDEVLFDVLDKKKIEYPGRKAQLNFITEGDSGENLLLMKGNRHLLYTAFSNVIDNAFKFSGVSNVDISIDLSGEQLVVKIIDYGRGLTEGTHDDIFELFYRNPDNVAIPGHGIGLYLTKQILDLHKIRKEITSIPNQVTTFTLIFPQSL